MSVWQCQRGQSAWIMGVLNCTPDSFSDGGSFSQQQSHKLSINDAVAHALNMRNDGAALIDVGGESTRPGARPVSLDEELRRVMPVVEALVDAGCNVSIDTMKAEVMRQAIRAGVCMVNDITALNHDADSLEAIANSDVDVCLMHMQGTPETMQQQPRYDHVLDEVCAFFEARLTVCQQAGIDLQRVLLDPGIGFGKRLQHNVQLIANIKQLKRAFDLPVLMGVSRKSFLHAITGADISNREFETAAAVSISVFAGADVVRVHDVANQHKATLVASALRDAQQ